MASVFVVIPSYNGSRLLPACLASVQAGASVPVNIVVVDDGSADEALEETLAVVRKHAPLGTVLALPENREFAVAAGAGIEYALQQGADYLLLLNNDACLMPGCIDTLVHFMENNSHAHACQPLLVNMRQPERVQSAGLRCSLSGRGWDSNMGEEAYAFTDAVSQLGFGGNLPVLGCTAGAAFYRAEALISLLEHEEVLDSSLGMFHEDIDLSIRLQRQAGFPTEPTQSSCWCVPQALAVHWGGATVSGLGEAWKIFRTERNSIRMVWRYFPRGWKQLAISVALFTNLRVAVGQVVRGNPKAAWHVLRAAFSGCRESVKKPVCSVPLEFFHAWFSFSVIMPPKPYSVGQEGGEGSSPHRQVRRFARQFASFL